MPSYQPPLRDFEFVLFELLHAERMWQATPALKDFSRDVALPVLEEAGRVLANEWLPLNQSGDAEGATFKDGKVRTPNGFKQAFAAWSEGGWMSLAGDPRYGGQGMPRALTVAVDEMQWATNSNLNLYSTLTHGACVALAAHAPEAVRQQYLPKMYAGSWSGVMALTEAHAGTDLGLIKTKAEPHQDGSYRITGTKIFITAGEHDLTDNIVHLVLAKLPDAPRGSGGISLFVVPKFLPNDAGDPGERNAVSSLGVEHKMGIHGSATNVIQYDAAAGVLIGEAHKGLAAMFTMMNYERLSVGLQGLGLAEIAYQNAAAYARERLQGRAEGQRRGSAAADPIIAHADVRRMLLTQRALNEAGRAFSVLVGMALDVAKYSEDEEMRAQAERRVALLTPVCKAFLTDRGFDGCVMAQQVLGGHGYVREWGMEQYVRDVRIAQIYEGTNGVQAMDLLGRKVVRDGGLALNEWLTDLRSDISKVPQAYREPLGDAVALLQRVSDDLLNGAAQDPDWVGAAAVEYLDLFGYVAYAWLWARMAGIAQAHPETNGFYASKRHVADFYFAKLLPRIQSLAASIASGGAVLMALDNDSV